MSAALRERSLVAARGLGAEDLGKYLAQQLSVPDDGAHPSYGSLTQQPHSS
jgi:hypothetical protein